MLDNIATHPSSRYCCIDPFTGGEEHALGGIDCTKLEAETRARVGRFGERCEVNVGRSEAVLPEWMAGGLSFDFAYIDGDHHAAAVLRDSVLAWELLKPGGVLIWDDYGWTVMPDMVDRPMIAIESFLQCYAPHLQRLEPRGWQAAVAKVGT